MKKTLSFAAIHFSVAFTLAWLLTGEVLIASLIAMIEPMVNTFAFFVHDKIWQWAKPEHSLKVKTASFALVHFSVAFTVAWLLSGELLTGGVMALLEPSVNTFAFFFHEKAWRCHHPMATA